MTLIDDADPQPRRDTRDGPPPDRRLFLLAAALVVGGTAAYLLSAPERRAAVADKVAEAFREPPPGPQPTRGTLFIDGKPAKGAVVTFWPLPLEAVTWRTVKPQAMVEADGSFRPNSHDLHDGAKPGDYVVTVLWTGEGGGPGPDLLKGKYADPKRPVLRVTIGLGENVVEELRLDGVTPEPKPDKKVEPKPEPKPGV